MILNPERFALMIFASILLLPLLVGCRGDGSASRYCAYDLANEKEWHAISGDANYPACSDQAQISGCVSAKFIMKTKSGTLIRTDFCKICNEIEK